MTDRHDPLRIMTLTRGRAGANTEPVVKLLPSVLIGIGIITGVGFLFFREFVWTYSPVFGWPGWASIIKLLTATIVGGIITHFFIGHYEQNHAWEHGNVQTQRDAIKSRW